MSRIARLTTAIAATLMVSIPLVIHPANALPLVERSNFNLHCIAKYQPRGIQARADPFLPPLVGQLRCRLPAPAGFGYTIENQSAEEVCLSQAGTNKWVNNSNRVECMPPAVNAPVLSVPVFNAPIIRGFACTRWIYRGGRYICL